ncbi:hypothetical protein [Streptosporangium minutum]|uniref:Uncharacterized protein n=1 Tax=Streptosporangium minutum TaxID=569862 RepID=A0A243RXQ5_9ACTN|nr:hypothetical protein [Streptosporangium minutum]OUC99974.1 hypothetical protein CA984_00520 [Streptosporangium minutum]
MTAAPSDAACAERQTHDGAIFADPRSAAARTPRAKDRPRSCELTFFGYGVLPPTFSHRW